PASATTTGRGISGRTRLGRLVLAHSTVTALDVSPPFDPLRQNGASASTTARALWYRSAGSLASSLAITASRAGGASDRASLSFGGESAWCFSMISSGDEPLNGTRAVSK